jgi:hypothetical protein
MKQHHVESVFSVGSGKRIKAIKLGRAGVEENVTLFVTNFDGNILSVKPVETRTAYQPRY